MTAGGWTGPTIPLDPPCPACWHRTATTVAPGLIRCLGRVWSDDLGRWARCEQVRRC